MPSMRVMILQLTHHYALQRDREWMALVCIIRCRDSLIQTHPSIDLFELVKLRMVCSRMDALHPTSLTQTHSTSN